MLSNTDTAGAVTAAERIRERLTKRSLDVGNGSVKLAVSTGVAVFPINGDSPEALIVSADAALYQAKRLGRDRVVRASDGPSTTAATAPRKASSKTSTKSAPNGRKKAAPNSRKKAVPNSKKKVATNSRKKAVPNSKKKVGPKRTKKTTKVVA